MIGFLNAYHYESDPYTYQKQYAPMAMDYLNKYLSNGVKEYAVGLGTFPQDIRECEGWIISGSPASCYDQESWILKLIDFVKECHKNKVKVLGICFGHQLLAHALGGNVERSSKGWGVGIRDFKIVDNIKWSNGNKEDVSLLFFHQDQVVKLPSNAKLIASDDFCPNQMFSIEDHILGIQGHPEFTKEYSKFRCDSNAQKIGEAYELSITSLSKETDDEYFGNIIKSFFSY
jgi:GMP synthase-like glutamine amidotransferase